MENGAIKHSHYVQLNSFAAVNCFFFLSKYCRKREVIDDVQSVLHSLGTLTFIVIYIELTFLTGRKRTVDFQNHCL